MITLPRDVDAYLLGNVVRGLIPLEISGGGLAAYGPAAAVQKFLVNFLLRAGSDIMNPDRGTYFWRQLTTGQLRTEIDVTTAFTSAAYDAIIYLAGVRDADADDDEEVLSVELLSVVISANTVAIAATLTTRAGSAIEFTLPFEI